MLYAFIVSTVCCLSLTTALTDRSATGSNTKIVDSDDTQKLEQAVLNDISSAFTASIGSDDLNIPSRTLEDVDSAIRDSAKEDEETGRAAWKFLYGLANSDTFVNEYWQKRPLLIPSANTGGWIPNFFTVERDLRLIDNSYITGFKTAEILRNGTKTDTWALTPLKDNPARKTVWADVADALDGGTVYFNTAGSLWPNLGGLSRLTGYAFGLPPNVNVYVTPPGCKVSVPPHTDRQDVLVLQTQGAKRWRVFAPPPRSHGKDPLNRGKTGDVLSFEEMRPPLIDTVLQTGDCLYVPMGFPHTTDTSSPVDGVGKDVFQEPSVHLTMGLDTHVWCLSLAHLRWTLLQRCGKDFNLQIKDDVGYWNSMQSMPVGFLGGTAWKECVRSLTNGSGVNDQFKKEVASKLKSVLLELEPERWTAESPELPSDSEIDEVTEYMVVSHWGALMDSQDESYKNIDPSSEESLVKAFRGTQNQNLLMEKYGEFSKNEAFAQSFAQRRLLAEQRTKGAFS